MRPHTRASLPTCAAVERQPHNQADLCTHWTRVEWKRQDSLFFGLVGPLEDKFDVWRACRRVTKGQRLLHTLVIQRHVQGRVQADDAAAAIVHTNEE
ncbi:hypothetical protein E2C01_034241 [Portunus trituberculatus]|uniref:Uncharacterized protein n=1 Tax=Portunus trituberculatus TaxID=210409 RepID=A0A5B7F587_PORTR|nr:hypothetical protein [Portunus trituberculatus]